MALEEPPPAVIVQSLAIAMVNGSNAPLLLLDGDLVVVAASTSFCHAFGVDPQTTPGRSMFALGTGEWDSPRLHSLLHATVTGGAKVDAYELDLESPHRGKRRLIVNAHKLDYDDKATVRLLLSISDVTEARAHDREMDDLIHEKAVLLLELQHRVANSLQIIASILMQTAKRTQSDESRGALKDAHSRVMSVASLQRHLAMSTYDEVALRPYLTQLCASIAASMIADPSVLRLETTIDDASVSADVSVSIGLIVTELVINALKHAFPDNRPGHILVSYAAASGGWTLSVADDGTGMPPDAHAAKAGLGTTIVQALARQLKAVVTVVDAAPGTRVVILNRNAAVNDDAPMPEVAAV